MNLKKTNFSVKHLNSSKLTPLSIQIWIDWRRLGTWWWQ